MISMTSRLFSLASTFISSCAAQIKLLEDVSGNRVVKTGSEAIGSKFFFAHDITPKVCPVASGHPAFPCVPMRSHDMSFFLASFFLASLAKSKAACFLDAIAESALKDLP